MYRVWADGSAPTLLADGKKAVSVSQEAKTDLRRRGATLTMNVRGVPATISTDANGRCSTGHAETTLQGQECNYYEMLKASCVGPL